MENIVRTQTELSQLVTQLRGQPWIAVDTEFMRERTYYAQLCLVQIAIPDRIACVDPLALEDLGPLVDIVCDPDILKVFHSARQDLEVFFDLCGTPPAPVFDTQVAAGLLGYDSQISYAALVESLCAHKLEKSYTRADWAARPLTPEQIHYAEDDVRYLRDLYLRISARLHARKRMAWLEEDCARLTDPGIYLNEPADACLRFKQFPFLPATAQPLLRELASWREATAQEKNLPRSWVVRDIALIDLACRAPENLEQLAMIKGLRESDIRKWGRDMLQVIASAKDRPGPLPLRQARLTRQQAMLRDRMLALIRERALVLEIDPTVLATRRDIEQILHGNGGVLPLQGWRREAVGKDLLRVIQDKAEKSEKKKEEN